MSTPPVAWITAAEVVDGPCAGVTGEENIARLDRALLRATQLLYVRTGRRWPGVVTDTFRPNTANCGCAYGRPGGIRVPEFRLPGFPVVAITEVLIDGAVVDAGTYRVADDRFLVRMADVDTDRNEGWPCCQRMDRDETADDTFQVIYTWGSVPDDAGLAAAAALGCELSLAADPATANKCKLPRGAVKSITRQGLAMELATVLNLDSCGIPEVTYWLGVLDEDRRGAHTGAFIVDPAMIARQGRSVVRHRPFGS